MLHKIGVGFMVLGLLSCGFANNMSKENIELRIKPIGNVRIKHEQNQVQTDRSLTVDTPAPQHTLLAKTIYTKHCVVCHGSGLAGAPKFRDAQDWKVRLQARTINDLLATALKGLNAMPVKGTCNECSDEDLKAAITYMLPQ